MNACGPWAMWSKRTVKRRMLIFGVDGGTWRILQPAMDAGAMPFLSELCRRGCRGVLESTTPPKTPSAWTSFQTGRDPGSHGVYDFALWDRATRKIEYVNSRHYSDTLWDLASSAGLRVGVLNVPMTWPALKINGYMVTGLMTPSLERDWTWPPELAAELLAAVPGYHVFSFDSARQGSPHRDPDGFLDRMAGISQNRTKAALHLLQKEPLDLFMIHFQATDVVQHVLWGYLDQDHPYFSPRIRDKVFQRFYRCLDEQLRIVQAAFQAAGGDCLTLVISDHGFQSHYVRFQFGNWLVEEGLLRIRKLPRRFAALRDLLNRTECFGAESFLERSRFGRKIINAVYEPVFDIDWDHTRVYSFSRCCDGYVFFLDTDPDKRSQMEAQLREKLTRLVDPRTGRPVIEKILPRDRVYHGPRLEAMPDWILKPAPGCSVTGDFNPFHSEILLPVRKKRDFHIGKHHPDGVLVAAGPRVRPAARIAGARLIDIAPTVLAWLGLAVPESMDGTILQDLFARRIVETRGPGGTPPSHARPDTPVYSDEDIRGIEDRLRDLGYIE
jgi:predicted AlkP superfamily phosphohydrolase/phosphomutase